MNRIPARRFKAVSLIAGIVLSGLTLLSWTMNWFSLSLRSADATGSVVDVPGEIAAPALAALGLAGLALVAALAIAGPWFRTVLGVLQAAIGASVAWSALSAMANPVAASAPIVTEITGISGPRSVAGLVGNVAQSAWPTSTVVVAVAMVALGLFVAGTARSWPSAASRYQTTTVDTADSPRSAVSDWDSLSDGSDPTSR